MLVFLVGVLIGFIAAFPLSAWIVHKRMLSDDYNRTLGNDP